MVYRNWGRVTIRSEPTGAVQAGRSHHALKARGFLLVSALGMFGAVSFHYDPVPGLHPQDHPPSLSRSIHPYRL
jgi:hypothetical protein